MKVGGVKEKRLGGEVGEEFDLQDRNLRYFSLSDKSPSEWKRINEIFPLPSSDVNYLLILLKRSNQLIITGFFLILSQLTCRFLFIGNVDHLMQLKDSFG